MSDKSIESLQDILAIMDPEVHMNLKTAVELGRWQDGRKLSPEQLEYCLQAIIAYEQEFLPEQQRVGYIDRTGLKKNRPEANQAREDPADGHDQVMPINVIKH